MPYLGSGYCNPGARLAREREQLKQLRRAERRLAEFAAARKAKGWPA